MADTLAGYDLPFEGLEAQLMSWVKEALDLRHGTGNDPQGKIPLDIPDSPQEVLELLRRVRMRSDRVDGLLANAIGARGRARRALDAAKFAADNKLDQATSNRASHRREYESGKVIEADAKLESFNERRIAHQGAKLLDVAQEAYEQINKVSWQLNALRSDLRETLHALQFEAGLER